MSNWSHIAGAIRINSLCCDAEGDKKIKKEIEEKLGKIIHYESPDDDWDLPEKDKTPTGSEGGLKYSYTISKKDRSSLSRDTILIEGDLRDYDGAEDLSTILEWVNRLINIPTFFIRQGILQVEMSEATFFITYSKEKDKFIIK